MSLRNLIWRDTVTVHYNTPVSTISNLMRDHNVGAVIIIDSAIPKGIITDRDIVIRCISAGLDPKTTYAHEIMSSGVETVTIDEGIYDVAKKMRQGHVRRIAVLDSSGRLAGTLAFDDVFDLLTEELCGLRDATIPIKTSMFDKTHASTPAKTEPRRRGAR